MNENMDEDCGSAAAGAEAAALAVADEEGATTVTGKGGGEKAFQF
jgi:hypothetical protein